MFTSPNFSASLLTSIMDSDAIAVIANGKIAELGDHETLLQNEDGIYRLLCESQGIKPGADVRKSRTEDGSVAASIAMASPEAETAKDVEEGLVEAEEAEEDIPEETEVATASMSTIWKYVGWDSFYTLIGVIGSGGVGALSPCESILTAKIVNTFYTASPDQMIEENLPYIAGFLLFALGSLVGNMMVGYGLSRSGSKLGVKLRSSAFESMLKKSMGWFDLPENTTGELTTILAADTEAVEGLVGLPLGYRVRVLVSITTGVAIALAYSYEVGLVAIACVPFIMIAGMIQVCCTRKKTVGATAGPSPPTIMEQGLRSIASVQAYNLESKVGDDYERALAPESAGKVQSGMIAGAVFGFSQMAGEQGAVFLSVSVSDNSHTYTLGLLQCLFHLQLCLPSEAIF